MADESSRIELRLDPDPRLTAAVATVVSQLAERAGLDPSAQVGLAAAAEQACREVSNSPAGQQAALNIVVENVRDRIEITLSLPGEASLSALSNASTGAGADTNWPDKLDGKSLSKGVDEVLHEMQEGVPRIKLIKYLGPQRK